jgi:DNA repair protein RadC
MEREPREAVKYQINLILIFVVFLDNFPSGKSLCPNPLDGAKHSAHPNANNPPLDSFFT